MTIKIWVVCAALGFLLSGNVYAQEKKAKTKEYHLRKAKRDRTVAFITGGISVVCITSGIIYGSKDGEGIGEVLGNGVNSVFFYAGGLTSGLTCIGFVIGSGYHRRKAALFTITPVAYADRLDIPVVVAGQTIRSAHVGVRIRF